MKGDGGRSRYRTGKNMNKVYRSIWNKTLGAFVAASELCVAQSKGRSGRTLVSSGAHSRKDHGGSFGDLGLKRVPKKHLAVLLTCIFVTDAWAQLAGGTATGTGSVATGPGSTASNTRSVAYGNTATASGVDAVSLGVFSVATGDLVQAVMGSAAAQRHCELCFFQGELIFSVADDRPGG